MTDTQTPDEQTDAPDGGIVAAPGPDDDAPKEAPGQDHGAPDDGAGDGTTAPATEPGAELEGQAGATLAQTVTPTLDKAELVAWLRGDDIAEADASDDIAYEQALRILTAENPDAVLRDDEVRKSSTLVGTPFVVRSVSWRKSTKAEDGAGRYAFMSCVDENGEPFYTSCGATKVVLQLRKAEVESWLPWQVEMEEIDTNNGRSMLQLTAPSKPF